MRVRVIHYPEQPPAFSRHLPLLMGRGHKLVPSYGSGKDRGVQVWGPWLGFPRPEQLQSTNTPRIRFSEPSALGASSPEALPAATVSAPGLPSPLGCLRAWF